MSNTSNRLSSIGKNDYFYLSKLLSMVRFGYLVIFMLLTMCQVTGRNNEFSRNKFPAEAIDTAKKNFIASITIAGNKKTKNFVILQEMSFKEGDSLSNYDLEKNLLLSKQQIYNTRLFTSVQLNLIRKKTDAINVEVVVAERWYLYPVPKFKLTDRNLNDWIQNQGADLNRVIYGMNFYHYNLTGRNDPIKITALNGFTQTLALSYNQRLPHALNRTAITMGVDYNRSKAFIYQTDSSNKALFYNDNSFSRKSFSANIGFSWRKNLLRKNSLQLLYQYIWVSDSVTKAFRNPTYLNASKSFVQYLELSYRHQFTNVDKIAFPLKGSSGYVQLVKRGLSLSGEANMFNLSAGYNFYKPLSNTWFAAIQTDGMITLPFKQAYINKRALGYNENYLRGLELYVVDGVAMGLIRLSLKKKLFQLDVSLLKKSKYLNHIPISVYGLAFNDWGYVYQEEKNVTGLNNRLLRTAGLGIEVLSLYDFNVRMGYGFNQLNTNGFFIHIYNGF